MSSPRSTFVRGNLGIVSKPSIKSIEGLRDAKVATTRNTPTHFLLLSLLKKSNLSPAEVEKVKSNLVFATKTPQAGELFKRGEVDAVAIWEPHLSQAMEGGRGRLLVSTTNLHRTRPRDDSVWLIRLLELNHPE